MKKDKAKHYGDLTQLYREVDRDLAEVLAAYEEEDIRPACTAGCCACCSQLVVATRLEAEAAARFLKNRPDFEYFWENLAAWYARMKDTLQNRPHTPEEWEAFASGYRKLEEPCPFLFEKKCSIYPVRPVPCRMLHVAGSPQACADPDGLIEQLGWYEEACDPALDYLINKSEAGVFPLLVASALA